MLPLKNFSYTYPKELIAQHPLPQRDASRMMVLHRREKTWEHQTIKELPNFLREGDLLILNDTKVFPARLLSANGVFEILLLEKTMPPKRWRALGKPFKKIKGGMNIHFGENFSGKIIKKREADLEIEFETSDITAKVEEMGLPPLPPYIQRKKREDYSLEDKERYQSIFACHEGSSAAPTASLHFSSALLEKIKMGGIEIATLTLHVSTDTFLPIRTENILEHRMHGEYFFIPEETKSKILKAKKEKRRVIAVGTTVVRALESDWKKTETHLFITPGFSFQIIDAVLTNFHQPESTLMVLVASFVGRECLLKAYNEAISRQYRLFSFGDCMLIL